MSNHTTLPKKERKLVVMLTFYWSGVDFNQLQTRELTANIDPETVIRLHDLLHGSQDHVIAHDTIVRALATLRVRNDIPAHEVFKEVEYAERVMHCLYPFLGERNCDNARGLFSWLDEVRGQQVYHDPIQLKQLQRQAITIVMKHQQWEKDWHRWHWLKRQLDITGITPDEVSISSEVFDQSYGHATVTGWAPELLRRIRRHSGSTNPLDQYMGSGAANILVEHINDGWITWEQASITLEELTGLVQCFDDFPEQQERFMRLTAQQ